MKKVYLSILLLGLYINLFSADINNTVCYIGFTSTEDNPTINGLIKKANEIVINDLAISGKLSIVNISKNKPQLYNIDKLSGYPYFVYGSIESSGDTYTITLFSKNTNEMTISKNSEQTTNVLDIFSICDELFDKMVPSITSQIVISNKQEDIGDHAPTIDSINSYKIHEWLFNGNLNDEINSDTSWVGKAKYTNDRKNQKLSAIDCSSDSTILKQKSNYDLYNDFTISTWVVLTNNFSLTYGRIYDCMQWKLKTGYNIFYFPDCNAFAFSYLDENKVSHIVKTTETINPYIWHNVIVSLKNGTSCLYLDGKLQEMKSSNHSIRKSERYISIGNGFDDGTNQPLYGNLDDILIFSRALTPQEVSVLYQTF